MGGGILAVACYDKVRDEGNIFKHAVAFGNDVFPDFRILDIRHHQLVHGGVKVGEEVYLVPVRFCGCAGILHVLCNLDPLGAGFTEVHDVKVVAYVGAVLVEEGHGFFVVHTNLVEPEGLCGVGEEELVIGLGSANLVVVDLVDLVLAAELVAVAGGGVVGAVVEAVAAPGCSGELGPDNVVFQELTGLGVHYVDLFPVASAAGDGVCGVLAVIGEIHALEGYGAVVTELVGIKEHVRLCVRGIHFIEDTLVLEAVVAVVVPLAVLALAGNANLLIVGNLREPLEQLCAERNLLQVCVRNLVLGLNPGGGLLGSIVLKPAVRICHLGAEIIVYSIVFARHGCLGSAGVK